MKYIFYDTETTGLSSEFDQILQFAALEVDEYLNEKYSLNIRCRILPYIVPSPGALFVTNVSPKDLVSPNHSHLEMISEIRNWILGKCPCMFIGHNSIKFDESFLRHAFYKTLHPIYLTNTQGNTRGDTMRIAHAAALFAPGSLTIPLSAKGNPTFRLGDLARANGIDFKDEDAHDALADVRATLDLARLLRRKAPKIWEQMMGNGNKKTALSFMFNTPAFCLGEVNFGNSAAYVVTAIANNPNYDAEMAVFDLSYDPSAYMDYSVEKLVELIKGKEKPIRVVAANSQPMIVDTAVGHVIIEGASLSEETLNQRVLQIKSAAEFRERVAVALTMRYEKEEAAEYVEKAIYHGFPSRADEAAMTTFHKAAAEDRAVIIQKIQDTRYVEMAMRLIYADHQDHMGPIEKYKLEKDFKDRLLTEEAVPWLTIPAAFKEIEELKAHGNKLELLAEIKVFLKAMHERVIAG